VGDLVRTGGKSSGVADHRRAIRPIGAPVDQEAGLDVDQRAVAQGAVSHPDPRRMSVDVAVKRFLAAIAHLHGAPGAQRQHARMNLHTEILARAEGAANPRYVQPDFFWSRLEAGS